MNIFEGLHLRSEPTSCRRPLFVIRNECQLYFNQTTSPICESSVEVASNFGRRGLLYVDQACCSGYTLLRHQNNKNVSHPIDPWLVLHNFEIRNEACASIEHIYTKRRTVTFGSKEKRASLKPLAPVFSPPTFRQIYRLIIRLTS